MIKHHKEKFCFFQTKNTIYVDLENIDIKCICIDIFLRSAGLFLDLILKYLRSGFVQRV